MSSVTWLVAAAFTFFPSGVKSKAIQKSRACFYSEHQTKNKHLFQIQFHPNKILMHDNFVHNGISGLQGRDRLKAYCENS
jgi:hypothetical protein